MLTVSGSNPGSISGLAMKRPTPVRWLWSPLISVDRVGEQTGFAQALRNNTPWDARLSTVGVGGGEGGSAAVPAGASREAGAGVGADRCGGVD